MTLKSFTSLCARQQLEIVLVRNAVLREDYAGWSRDLNSSPCSISNHLDNIIIWTSCLTSPDLIKQTIIVHLKVSSGPSVSPPYSDISEDTLHSEHCLPLFIMPLRKMIHPSLCLNSRASSSLNAISYQVSIRKNSWDFDLTSCIDLLVAVR